MNLDIYSRCKHVACIVLQNSNADGYNAAEPWLLLHNTGRVDRFRYVRDARAEAVKTYPSVRFNRKRYV